MTPGKDKRPVFIISSGGLGDVLLSTPSFKALKKKYPDKRIIVFCKRKEDKEIFRNNPHIDEVRNTSFWSNPRAFLLHRWRRAEFLSFPYGALSPSLNYKISAKEIIAEMLGVQLEDKNVQVYLTQQEDRKAEMILSAYKHPVVIHITSLTSDNQDWPLENWKRLIATTPECTFIQLGLPKEERVEGAVDLRGKTSFRETLAILKHAKSFVGVVSSLSHATNAFNVPGVVLFGASAPEVWGHPNNVNLYRYLRCSPCIDLLLNSPCPYGKPCMTEISVEEVREALMQQISHRNI